MGRPSHSQRWTRSAVAHVHAQSRPQAVAASDMQLVAHLADAARLLRVDFRPDLVVGFGHRAAEVDIAVRDLQADVVRVEPPVMAQGLMQVLADVVIGASGARGSAAAVGAPAVVGALQSALKRRGSI